MFFTRWSRAFGSSSTEPPARVTLPRSTPASIGGGGARSAACSQKRIARALVVGTHVSEWVEVSGVVRSAFAPTHALLWFNRLITRRLMDENIQLRDAILSFLRTRQDEVSLPELLEAIPGYDPIEIKSAVWQLMSDRAIELTPRRNLRAVVMVMLAG